MIVSLVGLRGVGKTTVARTLAAQLLWDCVDLDAEIERRAGRTVADLLTRDGEEAFRERESQALAETLTRDPLILSTGGGVVLRPENRQRLGAAGPVVWLQATPEAIRTRLAAHPELLAARPPLTAAGTLDEIDALAARREPLYQACASLAVRTDDKDERQIAAEIIERLGLEAPAPPTENLPR